MARVVLVVEGCDVRLVEGGVVFECGSQEGLKRLVEALDAAILYAGERLGVESTLYQLYRAAVDPSLGRSLDPRVLRELARRVEDEIVAVERLKERIEAHAEAVSRLYVKTVIATYDLPHEKPLREKARLLSGLGLKGAADKLVRAAAELQSLRNTFYAHRFEAECVSVGANSSTMLCSEKGAKTLKSIIETVYDKESTSKVSQLVSQAVAVIEEALRSGRVKESAALDAILYSLRGFTAKPMLIAHEMMVPRFYLLTRIGDELEELERRLREKREKLEEVRRRMEYATGEAYRRLSSRASKLQREIERLEARVRMLEAWMQRVTGEATSP